LPLFTQTNYCAASFATVPYAHEDAAPLFLLANALSTSFLHREIREKGGAYGGGAAASPLGASFGFSSYRDPNTAATISTFTRAAEWAATNGNITAAEVGLRSTPINVFGLLCGWYRDELNSIYFQINRSLFIIVIYLCNLVIDKLICTDDLPFLVNFFTICTDDHFTDIGTGMYISTLYYVFFY
jgi:hypothetical protein